MDILDLKMAPVVNFRLTDTLLFFIFRVFWIKIAKNFFFFFFNPGFLIPHLECFTQTG